MFGIPAYEHIHHGGAVKTKEDHPYNYDPIRHFHRRERGDVASAYDDRMQQWDHDQWRDTVKIMNDKHGGVHKWRLTNGHHAQEVLRLYYDAPKLVLIDLVEFCNASSGYAHFLFCFVREPDTTKPLSPAASLPPKKKDRTFFDLKNRQVSLD